MASWAPLEGEKAALVPLSHEHVPELLRILATPEVRQYWGEEATRPGWPFDDPESTRFSVVVDGQVRGMAQFYEEDDPMYRHASIDIFLDPQVHGRGVGRDVVATLSRYLFEQRGHHRLVIDPSAENQAAVRCYSAAGFRVVGTMRQYEKDVDGGQWHDGLLMERLARDFTGPATMSPGGPAAGAEVRMATVDDVAEVLRLAGLMYSSVGMAVTEEWRQRAAQELSARLGRDVAVFVAYLPSVPGRLLASAAGSIGHRLPGPANPSGRAGYVQWVWTEPEVRGGGLGRAVMADLLEWFTANGVSAVELHASPQGAPLYRSLGFSDGRMRALRARLGPSSAHGQPQAAVPGPSWP